MTIENNKQNCSDSIFRSLVRTSDWRKNLQTRFPTDPRNGRAAEKLRQFADETDGLTDEAWAELKPFYSWSSEHWSNAVSEASRRPAAPAATLRSGRNNRVLQALRRTVGFA